MTPADARERLDARLTRTASRLRLARRAQRVARAAAALLGATAAVVLLDALAAPGPVVRTLAAYAIAALGVWVILSLRLGARARRHDPVRAGAMLERAIAAPVGRVLAGVQLREAAIAGPGLRAALAQRAVDRAASALGSHPGADGVDWRPARRAGLALLVGAGALAGVELWMPGAIAAGAPRLLQPDVYHPAYTRARFDVAVDPALPLVGDDVRLRVDVRGGAPAELRFVIVESSRADAPVTERIPMRAAGEGAFTLTLRRVREPMLGYFAGDTGASRLVRIGPIPAPRVLGATLSILSPDDDLLAETPLGADAAAEAIAPVGAHAELRLHTSIPLSGADVDGPGDLTIEGDRLTLRTGALAEGLHAFSVTPRGPTGVPAPGAVRVTLRVDPGLPLAPGSAPDALDAQIDGAADPAADASPGEAGGATDASARADPPDPARREGGAGAQRAQGEAQGGAQTHGEQTTPPRGVAQDTDPVRRATLDTRAHEALESVAAEVEHLPEAYRERVRRYFLRILRDDAARTERDR